MKRGILATIQPGDLPGFVHTTEGESYRCLFHTGHGFSIARCIDAGRHSLALFRDVLIARTRAS
jgi:hypothetical protein